jgi:DNA-binding FrmR family transcriptional regulator
MANTIILKRSATQNNIPTTSQLELGEVAINTYDGKVYIKKSVSGSASIVEVGPVVSVNGSTGAVTIGTDETAEGSTNLYYTDARVRAAISAGTGITYNSTSGEIQTAQDITTAGSPSFAGLTLTGNAETLSLIPASDNVYSLGSASKAYADIYVGPGSLYINGKKTIEDNSNTMTFSTDSDQDMRVSTSGSGSVELLASGTGNIQVMGTLSIQTSKRIVDSAGVNVEFGDPIHMNSNKLTNLAEPTASTDGATKNYVDTAITNLVDASPATLDTLNELAAALGDDANFSTTITTSIATKLNSADYTASDVLTKIKTVDGAASGLDADILDGQQGSYYLDANNFTNMPDYSGDFSSKLDASSYTASDVLTKIKTVDGAGSGLDADLLDGQSSAYYATASSVATNTSKLATIESNATADQTASEILTLIKTVDGAGSGLDADLLDGQSSAYYLDGNNFINMPATGVTSVATSNGLTGGTITGTGTLSMSGSYTGTFNVTGEIKATGEVTAYFSDERLKKDIVPVTGALQGVMAMGGYTYKANDLAAELGVERTDNQIGLLAQEVEAQFPELVTESALAGYKTIRYDKMVTVLVEAMKEQQAMIEQLQADVKKTLH